MDFPKRIKQHKSQSDSFAILLYRLKDLGIFRNATENDYGIDFEIEIVHQEKVIGRYLKAQVKSAEEVFVRNDKIPTVGGIKQSTLLYWTELSFRSHVVVFAVDLSKETIYFSKSIFWQSTLLLDNSEATKTIEFLPAIELLANEKEIDSILKLKTENSISALLIKKIAFEPSISDIIFAHKMLLRNLKQVYELYTDTWHYDAWTEVQSLDMLKTLLDCSRFLIELPEKIKDLNDDDKKHIFSFEYWAKKTNWSGEDVSNEVAKTPLKIITPLLLDKLQFYSDLVLKGCYYWQYKDLPYLKFVHSVVIPKERTHKEICQVNYDQIEFTNKESFHTFYSRIPKAKSN